MPEGLLNLTTFPRGSPDSLPGVNLPGVSLPAVSLPVVSPSNRRTAELSKGLVYKNSQAFDQVGNLQIITGALKLPHFDHHSPLLKFTQVT